eukprot:TRINITY_DN10143_c0_g1_i1.p1 TRINITY_DN10143_c0_g1~~TRINITY_DN10143_c0_g1_i1.p1  ORF type:complete len:291 (+),score=29.44 TRINITY_DN10143_c0_g1_i1:64-936(+)
MSAAGDEFMKELWSGKVPVQFNLSSDSLAGLDYERPTPFFNLVPRVGYLSFFLQEVQAHYQGAAATRMNNKIWLSRDEGDTTIPIKWHYPMGVIFDQLMLREKKETHEMLPLQLSVHFSPVKEPTEITSLASDSEATSLYHQHIKQAYQVQYNSTKIVTNLPMEQWRDLIKAVKECNYMKYANIKTQMRKDAGSSRIPVLVHYNGNVWLRAPATPTGDECLTLGGFLEEYFGKDFSFTPEQKASDAPIDLPNTQLLIHGVSPPASTPLLWLAEYMAYPDCFLHITIETSS